MKKSIRIVLMILSILAAGLLILLILAYANKKEPVEQTVLPTGSLSSDFFVSQNMVYEPNAAFSEQLPLTYAPYTFDVPKVLSGTVGEGTVFNLDTLYNLYISEADEEQNVTTHLLLEYPKSVLIGAEERRCSYDELENGTGYINGFDAEYSVGRINIGDGESRAEQYIVYYLLKVPEYHENVFVGCTTTILSTDSLKHCEQMSVAVIKTMQYKADMPSLITLRRPPIVEEESEIPSEEPVSEEESEDAEIIPEVPNNAIVQIEEISIDREYQDLILEYTWENEDTMIEAKLYSGGTKFSPTRYERGKAIFELGVFHAGSYQIEIRGLNYGETKAEFKGE